MCNDVQQPIYLGKILLQNFLKKSMKYSNLNKQNLTEKELSRKLLLNLIGILGIILVVILSLFVFAPKVGFIFGLFSVHRNDPGYIPTLKTVPPEFVDLPKSVNTDQASLHGYAQPGTVVVLYANGPEVARVTAGTDGQFNFTGIKLNEGKNTLFAKGIDEKNVESDKTDYFYITLDKQAPKFDELSPKDGDTVRNLDKRVEVTGKMNELTTVTVNGSYAVQRPDFTFDFILGVSEGDVKITVAATDEAGNKTEKILNITYEKKSL